MAKAKKRSAMKAAITKIIERARQLGLVDHDQYGNPHWYTSETMCLDLYACVCGAFRDDQAITGFNLEKLAAFDDFNFTHDIVGIARLIDRETGDMRGHFMPRCARG